MADINQIQVGTTTYDIADTTARNSLSIKADLNHTHEYLPLSGGVVTGQLILSKTADVRPDIDNTTALSIGATTGIHLEFNGNEIMAKDGSTTTSTLYLNISGGDVSIGNGGLKIGTPLAPDYGGTGRTKLIGTNSLISDLFPNALTSASTLYFFTCDNNYTHPGYTNLTNAWTALGGGDIGKKSVLTSTDIPNLDGSKITSGNINRSLRLYSNNTSIDVIQVLNSGNENIRAFSIRASCSTVLNSVVIGCNPTTVDGPPGGITINRDANNNIWCILPKVKDTTWQGDTIAIAYGGTGATTAALALKNLAPTNLNNGNIKYVVTQGTDRNTSGYSSLAQVLKDCNIRKISLLKSATTSLNFGNATYDSMLFFGKRGGNSFIALADKATEGATILASTGIVPTFTHTANSEYIEIKNNLSSQALVITAVGIDIN